MLTLQRPPGEDGITWNDYPVLSFVPETGTTEEVRKPSTARPYLTAGELDRPLVGLWQEIQRLILKPAGEEIEYSPMIVTSEAMSRVAQIKNMKFTGKQVGIRYQRKELNKFY